MSQGNAGLPGVVERYIERVARKAGWRRKLRREVRAELAGHFEDALRGVEDPAEREKAAERLIAEFGDAKAVGRLIKRGKKRCRPLWVKATLGMVKIAGIIILYTIIAFSRLLVGTPGEVGRHISTYKHAVRESYDESQNAQMYFEKAVNSITQVPYWLRTMHPGFAEFPLDLPQSDFEKMGEWLASNEAAMQILREGVRQPAYWFEYELAMEQRPWLFYNQMIWRRYPSTAAEGVTHLVFWHGAYNLHRGNYGEAIDSALLLARIACIYQRWGGEEQMYALRGERDAQRLLYWIVESGNLLEAELAELYDELAGMWSENVQIDFSWYRLVLMEEIEHSYTERGRALAPAVVIASDNWIGAIAKIAVGAPSKNAVFERLDDEFASVQEMVVNLPWEWESLEDIKFGASLTRPFWREMHLPYLLRVAQQSWIQSVLRCGLMTVIAVERFGLAEGRLPGSLEEVVAAGYIEEVPRDPFGPGPLVYRLTEDGYTIYSRGPNLVDNGGTPARDDRGRLNIRGQYGDVVFWPVVAE